jgi:hypothetical protein
MKARKFEGHLHSHSFNPEEWNEMKWWQGKTFVTGDAGAVGGCSLQVAGGDKDQVHGVSH